MLTRKCALCGEKIEVSLPYSKKYIYYATKKKWYHLDCFTAVITPRTHVGDWINKTSEFVNSEVSKDNICQLFYKHYNVTCISTRLFKKLDEIYKGTYKGLAQPIHPSELYDILVRKMSYLDSNARRKGLDGEQRANYDLAVAMGSYGSYKAWLTKVKADQAEAEDQRKQVQADPDRYKLWGYVEDKSKPKEQIIDFDELLEDD